MNNDLLESLLILRSPRIGPATYNNLLQQFGSAGAVLERLGVTQELRDSVLREIDAAQKMNIRFVFDSDDLYPGGLRDIKNHPPIITVRGNIDSLGKECIGIVGTRHATAAGMSFVSGLANAFAEHNICVVSGMAMGTDTAAHSGALRSKGNTNTIAVLAGGVDSIWPLENERLYYEILERGAVISEMPIGFSPKAQNFVQRNRLIAGLVSSVIISEADSNSGSMRTAQFAMQYGRKIYAIPSHPADSRSVGPNSLIRSGAAILCQGVEDFFVKNKKEKKDEKKSESENAILDKLGTIPLSESVLADIVEKSVSEIKRELVVLELQGLVRKQDDGYVRV
ncbi:MAG: DNA-processing protein DprA [Alphaproteobacteria bacterium]|nr:DNA-processing protein DprA [Alphaproteobacteria bacterium]